MNRYSLRAYRASIHNRAHTTTRDSIGIFMHKDRLKRKIGWWNHDFREQYECPWTGITKIRFRKDFLEAFAEGDPLTESFARQHGVPVRQAHVREQESRDGWLSATLRHESRVCPSQAAHEARMLRDMAAERAAKKANTPEPPQPCPLWTALHETGASGLGKAKRKVAA